jgi:hypothetical protein
VIIQVTLKYDIAEFDWPSAADFLARYFLAVLSATIQLPTFKYGTSISETPVNLYKAKRRLVAGYRNFKP